MNKRNILLTWLFIFLLIGTVACSGQEDVLLTSEVAALVIDTDEVDTVTESDAGAITTGSAGLDSGAETADATTVATSVATESAQTVTWDTIEELSQTSSSVTEILLDGETITVAGEGVTVDGRTATITAAGTYTLSGSLAEGQVVVDTSDEEAVQLILNGVNISNTSTSPLFIANAEQTVILLAENSENYLADGADYVFADAEQDEPNAALFSKDDLLILGAGSLTVEANYNDGIASKDDLVIAGGTLVVDAVDDGLRGKESLTIKDGTIIVTAQGDGLKADEEDDPILGTILIEGGQLDIISGGDALQAATGVLISGGDFAINAGGGSANPISADTSAKGIKGGLNVIIDGGSFTINAADDALHANEVMIVNNGFFVIATRDDGFHADASLTINGGVIQITESYEGIESALITINGGDINVVSSDDGLNVAGGNDGSGFGPGGGGRPPGRGGFNGGPGQDTFVEYTGDYYLYINGGAIVIDAGGDGIDANGAIEMTDGVLIINGPTAQMNGALDYDGTFTMAGGFMVAAGSAGMAQTADASSTQNALLINFNGTLSAGTLIHIADGAGNTLLTFAPTKAVQSIAFSSPELRSGETYTVYTGGSDSGAMSDGPYTGGTYSGGSEYTSFTVSSTVTTLGNAGRW